MNNASSSSPSAANDATPRTAIIFADDDLHLRAALASVLRKMNYVVHECNNGREALRALDAHSVQLVITDVLMPENDGLELLQQLSRRQPRLPVIAISGDSYLGADTALRAARSLGANRTLPKPFQPSALINLVGELLGGGCGAARA